MTGQDHLAEESIVGLTPSARATSAKGDDRRAKLGGLVEFYRSPARVAWTPTGTNVPDYPKLAPFGWWKNVAVAVTGEDAAGRRWTTSPEMDR